MNFHCNFLTRWNCRGSKNQETNKHWMFSKENISFETYSPNYSNDIILFYDSWDINKPHTFQFPFSMQIHSIVIINFNSTPYWNRIQRLWVVSNRLDTLFKFNTVLLYSNLRFTSYEYLRFVNCNISTLYLSIADTVWNLIGFLLCIKV